MSTQVTALADVLLRRVRAEGGLSVTHDDAFEVLSLCQKVANTSLQKVVSQATLTTNSKQAVYGLSEIADDIMNIVSVVEGTRTLFPVRSFSEFLAISRDWFREKDEEVEAVFVAWMQLGRDYFFLYPSKTVQSSVTVNYIKETDDLVVPTDIIELPEDSVEMMLLMAEIVLLARLRLFVAAETRISQLTGIAASGDK